MSQARALSPDEIHTLRSGLDGGGTPTVWFTASAVGVQEGRSGKVLALDEPAEGDFIQVRPAGSKDVLSFSAGEVTLVKPPRKRKEAESKPPKAPAKVKSAESRSHAETTAATRSAPADSTKRASSPPAQPASSQHEAGPTTTRRKPRQPTGATVTLTADQTGQWSVEVSTGKKRVLRPRAVPASAVAQAANALHEEVADAVEPLLSAAREQQQARVEQLQQELEEAQRMLEELG